MKYKFYAIFFFYICLFSAKAGVPDIINFTTKEYNGHSINYDITQGANGVILVGNAYGVLEYDGSSFRKIALNDGKSAISLCKNKQGDIFIGSSSEIGCLVHDSILQTSYKSLKHLIPGNPEINEVFKTLWFEDAIYFACPKGIYRYKNDKIEAVEGIKKETIIDEVQIVKDELLYWEADKGLGKIKGLKAEIFIENTQISGVNGIEFLNKEYFIFGEFGTHPLRNEHPSFAKANEVLKKAIVTCVINLNSEELLIGTQTDGIYLMNSKGELTRNFNTKHGLQDNFIRNLFQDKTGNIWIAYNNGIGVIKWRSPLEYLTNSQGFEGMGYSGITYKNKLYIGTSTGLYYLQNWRNGLEKIKSFKKVEGLPEGTINYLTIENGRFIICQAAETYTLVNNKVKRISDGKWYGSWIWKTAHRYNKNEGFVGTYEGIERYLFKNNEWVHQGHIKGFSESSRVMEIDDRGVIWTIQGNKGLYRVELNTNRDSVKNVTNYVSLGGFKADDFNDIFRLNKKIYITTFKGVFFLKGDSLIPDPSFKNIAKYVNRARLYDENKLYGIYNDQPYLLEKQNEGWQIKPSAISFSRSSLVGSAEFFQKISKDEYLIGTQDGFTIYRPSQENKPNNLKCLIRNVEIIGEVQDSMLFFNKPQKSISFDYNNNNLRFTFSFPEFGEMNRIIYQVQLKRGDKTQSTWQNVKGVNYKEFTNLKEGDYTFLVRALKGDSAMGVEQYSFSIKAPWYKTTVAIVFYLIGLVIFGIFIRSRFIQQAEKLKKENEKELKIKERLHNAEKLEIELKNKENELAYMALSYTQKKEMLSSVESKLDSLSKELEHSERTKVNSLKRTISSSIDDESNWDNFQVHFDQKNNNFFKKLKEVDAKLNESYLLFCSYVKMGKSNKEIADLLNISVAAVEKRKYRLKKKWSLDNETSFTDFLRSL